MGSLGFLLSDRPGILPRVLSVRVARSIIVRRLSRIARYLVTYRSLNIAFSLSSFKAKCSSLDCLGRLPARSVGVSGSFVHSVLVSGSDLKLAGTVVNLTGSFGHRMVTRKIRAIRRKILLVGLNYSMTRNCNVTGPVPMRGIPS